MTNSGQRHQGADPHARREVVIDPTLVKLPETLQELPRELLAESYRRCQLLYELSRRICAKTDSAEVFAAVVDALQQLFATKRCFVATIDAEGQLRARACRGIELTGAMADWPVSRTIINRVHADGVALLIPNAIAQLAGTPSVARHDIRSVICAPLGPRGGSIGIIYADNNVESERFSELDLSLLSLISHYVSLAIRNAARLEEAEIEARRSAERCSALQSQLLREHRILGGSPALLEAFALLKRAAASDLRILLLGENGTGKELFAKAAHRLSRRANECFLPVHVAALSDELVESELFGHESGAFTGASRRKIGKFELAQRGTVFLDEVAEIPLHVQTKLLRVLENRQVERVGGDQPIEVDFRLICATNKDLAGEVQQGRFREDLYFRINGIAITLPPLRQRLDDIPILAQHVLDGLGGSRRLSPAAIQVLRGSPWPGNVRQLAHVVERAAVMAEGPEISAAELRLWLDREKSAPDTSFPPLSDVVAAAERDHIRQALLLTDGNKERAAKLLGIAKGTLYGKLERYGLGEGANP